MKRSKFNLARLLALAMIAIAISLAAIKPQRAAESATSSQARDERAAAIESALFTRAEFFGAQAIVPYPTTEARARLADIERRFPNDSEIKLKLAELDEKLNRIEAAHQTILGYVELEKNSAGALSKLAEFYDRRARFADEAATLERMIAVSTADRRAAQLIRLIELAERHDLKKYQQPDFFRKLIASEPAAFEFVKQFIEQLFEKEDYAETLRAVRQYKASFPAEHDYFLDKEVDSLIGLKREKEAEAVYVGAFDPFWSDERSRKFYYDFMSEHDRLRAYGKELKLALRRNPASFDAAVKLFHYQHYDYQYNDVGAAAIFTRLEKERAARGVAWKPEELATVARLLLLHDEADLASRFLYTLHNQGGLRRGSELREKVIYQIFELLLDAGDQRTALTAGDLSFYEDVAKSDPHPGMLGGVLSLLLADSNPQDKLDQAEQTAIAHFNRSAAYRVFNAFKQEYPTSPALAQMYLDLIRLQISAKDTAAAAALFDEFGQRYEDAPQFAEVALKLADACIQFGDHQRERQLYQRLLDHLGRRRKVNQALVPTIASDDPSDDRPITATYPPNTNYGYGLNDSFNAEEESYDYNRPSRFRAVSLTRGQRAETEAITYAVVLDRYVASLVRENRAADVIALYSAEIKKHPNEQGLYEQMLQWLGQTNLTEDQLRVYREAIKRFQSTAWTDRLARWYLRQGRKAEFEKFSLDLLGRMNDGEIENYLTRFVTSGQNDTAANFDANLFFSLYSLAHERFPHNQRFVEGLLGYYAGHKRWNEWQQLLAEHYFESKPIRERYLSHLAGNGRLREYAEAARERENALYKMFRADAAAWLSNFEEAVEAYRELNRLYPNTPEFAERLVSFTRSFGQKDQKSLEDCASLQLAVAEASPASVEHRTLAGEVYAELGDYQRAAGQWEQLLKLRAGDEAMFLETATIYWDYFQYDDALRIPKLIRRQKQDDTLYAFQIAAIYESQHKTKEALAEYVKELHPHSRNYWRTKSRLKILYARKDLPAQLRLALTSRLAQTRDANHRDGIVLGYAFLMNDLERWQEAAPLLKRYVTSSRWPEFLNNAQELFSEHEDTVGELSTLRRLAVVAKTERQRISYRLQLAESAVENGQKETAATLLSQLVALHPTNYGVLTEAADFYWGIGKRERSMQVLANAARRSNKKFRYVFARKLAARRNERGQLAAAEATLKKLYDDDPANLDVFRELAHIYVKQSNAEALRQRYRQTIRAVKDSETDHLALRQTIAELRQQVIEAFTQLRDYSSAIEQHMEIINRDPDEEENVRAAVEYAKRYGGADKMIEYYSRTSEQAFKDYRWNLVLARLYESKGDWAQAKREFVKAINNQPEMVELHSELAEAAVRAKDFSAAIDALMQCSRLSNDDSAYIKRLAEVLDKAGRKREADAARAKLPIEKPRQQTIGDQFAEAASLPKQQRAKAIAKYRQAFDAFANDFYKHELGAHELAGYVSTVRDEEALDQILRRLWETRERIRRDSISTDNLLAGKARRLLETFDRAIPESVGKVASEFATGEELAAVHRDLQQWASAIGDQDEADGTQAMLLNLCYRAGFNDLAEKILLDRKASAARLDPKTTNNSLSIYQDRLTTLINFYNERAAYGRIINLAEQELARNQKHSQSYYRSMIAEYARLIGDDKKELATLRAEFQSDQGNNLTSNTPMAERYFEALMEGGEAGRNELQQIANQKTPYRFQLINFLLRNNDLELARAAIKAAPLDQAWQNSRQAELSLAARDLNQSNEAYFLAALGWKTIGEMVADNQDSSRQLIGDNWFYLADDYGRWMNLLESLRQQSSRFLPAMLENKPKDAWQQQRLGRWLLEQKQPQQALEHLRLAEEMREGDKALLKTVWADIGSAYFAIGERQKAFDEWAKLIESEKPSVEDCQLYLSALSENGLRSEARAVLQTLVVKRLSGINRDSSNYGNDAEKDFESLKPLIRALAASFGKTNDGEKAAYLQKLCEAVPRDKLLAVMIVSESLVAGNQFAAFYEMLAKRSAGFSSWESDSDFVDRRNTHPTWSREEIEEAMDHAGATRGDQRESERLSWQKRLLEHLIAERRNAEASALISTVEADLKNRFARPDWLRLARLRLDVRAGRLPQALTGLRHFAGIEVSERIDEVSPPNAERLNQAVEMLRRENRRNEADELLRAACERQLAMEQLNETSFVGLARLSLAKGDAASGLKLLKLMTDLATIETRSVAAAELSALPQVKARAILAEWVEKPAAVNQLSLTNSLRLAAETAAEFGHYNSAIEYRQRLLSLLPEDNDCRIELARLLAVNNRGDDAAKLLASLIVDRRASRQSRWTALWIAPEIAVKRNDVWQSLLSPIRDGKDGESIAAAEALSVFDRGQNDSAISLLGQATTKIPSNQLVLLRAVMMKNSGRQQEALNQFAESLVSLSDSQAMAAFASGEDELRWQVVRLFAQLKQPRAALKLANADERLRGTPTGGVVDVNQTVVAKSGIVSLPARASERQLVSRLELLARLSSSAEQIREFDKAADFERARLASMNADERRKVQARIEQLKAKQKEKLEKRGIPLTVNDRPVTAL